MPIRCWNRSFSSLQRTSITHGKNATHLTISYTETADHLLLVFEDNGAGIPPDKKEKIFQRVIGSQNNLGLFFAREILDITGITVRETGIFGSGARFEMTVPEGMFRFTSQDKQVWGGCMIQVLLKKDRGILPDYPVAVYVIFFSAKIQTAAVKILKNWLLISWII